MTYQEKVIKQKAGQFFTKFKVTLQFNKVGSGSAVRKKLNPDLQKINVDPKSKVADPGRFDVDPDPTFQADADLDSDPNKF